MTDNHMLTIDELKENTTAIDCCYCGYSITTADLSDDDLQTLINTEHIPQDCNDCSGTFMIGIDKSEYEKMQYNAAFGVYEVGANYLIVEEVYRCRECGDLGEIYEDAFSPVAGHYEIITRCDCTKRSE
jgi:DNA-directed RNA polymerase subunit RPC12/RpoP